MRGPMYLRGRSLRFYAFGLHERDGDVAASAERQLVTPGVRLWQPIAPGGVDFQIEVMGQFGISHRSAVASDVENLEHVAFSAHVSCGYLWDVILSPRVAIFYDYASGDKSPEDTKNDRFDATFWGEAF